MKTAPGPNLPVQRFRLALVLGTVLAASMAVPAQQPPVSTHQLDAGAPTGSALLGFQPLSARKGVNEWGLTGGGGFGVLGGSSDGSLLNLAGRWGRVLTTPHGPGPLLGTLEYTVEAGPTLIRQQSTNIFGGGITPLLLQYNFVGAGRIVPFIQAGAGMLFTNHEVPQDTSQFNFTPQGGIGAYLFRGTGMAFATGVRFHHISNAGRTEPNPGRNSLYFYTGISWWR